MKGDRPESTTLEASYDRLRACDAPKRDQNEMPTKLVLRRTAQIPPLIDTSNPAISDAAETNGVLLRGLLRAQVGVHFGAPTARPALEHVGMM